MAELFYPVRQYIAARGPTFDVGELWAEVKDENKLLASVQDDQFINEYRDAEALAQVIAGGE